MNSTPSSAVLKRSTRNWSSHKSFIWTGELCTDITNIEVLVHSLSLVPTWNGRRGFYSRHGDDFKGHRTAAVFTRILNTCTDQFWVLLDFSVNRYLHKNIEHTHERRGEVKKLKEQLAALQRKLEW